jgi:ribosomal protein L24
MHNVSLDSFKKDIGQEVFVIGGDRKGYRGTLSSLSLETCTVAVRGQVRATLKLHDVVTR